MRCEGEAVLERVTAMSDYEALRLIEPLRRNDRRTAKSTKTAAAVNAT